MKLVYVLLIIASFSALHANKELLERTQIKAQKIKLFINNNKHLKNGFMRQLLQNALTKRIKHLNEPYYCHWEVLKDKYQYSLMRYEDYLLLPGEGEENFKYQFNRGILLPYIAFLKKSFASDIFFLNTKDWDKENVIFEEAVPLEEKEYHKIALKYLKIADFIDQRYSWRTQCSIQ